MDSPVLVVFASGLHGFMFQIPAVIAEVVEFSSQHFIAHRKKLQRHIKMRGLMSTVAPAHRFDFAIFTVLVPPVVAILAAALT